MKETVIQFLKHRYVRFALVAALNTAVGYFFFACFTFFGLHYTLAALFGTILSLLFNFKSYGYLVFKNKSNRIIHRFFAVYLLLYFTNIGGITLIEYLGIDNMVADFIASYFPFIYVYSIDLSKYLGAAIMVVPNGLLGYLLNSRFVFNKKNEDEKRV